MNRLALISDFAHRIRSGETFPVVQKAFGCKPLFGAVISQLDYQIPPPTTIGLTEEERRQAKRVRTTIKNEKERLKAVKKAARKDLAESLRAGRRRLRELGRKVKYAEMEADAIANKAVRLSRDMVADQIKAQRKKYRNIRDGYQNAIDNYKDGLSPDVLIDTIVQEYPPVPTKLIAPHRDGAGLPSCSGIYFLWNGDVIEYVGLSICLTNRLHLGHHHRLLATDMISYLPIAKRAISFAESYYIGILRPKRNFGDSGTHNRYSDVDNNN